MNPTSSSSHQVQVLASNQMSNAANTTGTTTKTSASSSMPSGTVNTNTTASMSTASNPFLTGNNTLVSGPHQIPTNPVVPNPISIIPQTSFGPIAGSLVSPLAMDHAMGMNFIAMLSPNVNDNFSFNALASPTATALGLNMNMNMMQAMHMPTDLSTMSNMAALSSMANQMQFPHANASWDSMLKFQPNFQQLPTFDIPPVLNTCDINVKSEEENNETGLRTRKRGRKRKIKVEHDDDYDDDDDDESFVVDDEETSRSKAKKRRGRSKNGVKKEADSLEHLLSIARTRAATEHGFVGIKNEFGEIRINVPVPSKPDVKYEMFGHACTEKIEDILQPKKRTRYVRGLEDDEKKDRRREQNRNAAARSRARKNAMIAKVIQLHQENLALRAYVSNKIKEMKMLENEKTRLQMTHE